MRSDNVAKNRHTGKWYIYKCQLVEEISLCEVKSGSRNSTKVGRRSVEFVAYSVLLAS